jgi:hypothetical protein
MVRNSRELGAADAKTAERRARYRASANDELRAVRARRLKSLEARAGAIERAIASYSELDSQPEVIGLRRGFIARETPRKMPPIVGGSLYRESDPLAMRRMIERQTRPPATQLIAERSRALLTAMTMLYVAQCESDERGRFLGHHAVAMTDAGPSWATLAGRHHSSVRTRRARMRRDLTHLAEVGVVRVPEDDNGRRFEELVLNREDEYDGPWRRPRPLDAPVLLPGSFFTNGWHLVLEPNELALFLAITHQHMTTPLTTNVPGLPMNYKVRFGTYGISSEAYTAIHELEEFGLIKTYDLMPNRRRGKIHPPTIDELEAAAESETSLAPVPYQLELVPGASERLALEVVLTRLRALPLPPRVTDLETLVSVANIVGVSVQTGEVIEAPTAPSAGGPS